MNLNNQDVLKNGEVTLSTLLNVLKKFVVLIILSTVICGSLAGAYSALFVKTKYSAKIEFVVVNVLDDNPYISDSL